MNTVYSLPVEEHARILGQLKPHFIYPPRSKHYLSAEAAVVAVGLSPGRRHQLTKICKLHN